MKLKFIYKIIIMLLLSSIIFIPNINKIINITLLIFNKLLLQLSIDNFMKKL